MLDPKQARLLLRASAPQKVDVKRPKRLFHVPRQQAKNSGLTEPELTDLSEGTVFMAPRGISETAAILQRPPAAPNGQS
jgi:hypothetical protein